jgi:hypothetical protein
MRSDGSLVGTRRGLVSALGPQPRRMHENEVWVGTPTRPWGSRRLPPTLHAGDPRRTLFRTLLRRAEGVEVTFADGCTGRVDQVVLSPIGFDFWPEALIVVTPEGRRRAPIRSVRRIDVRGPRLWLGPLPAERPQGRNAGGNVRHDNEHFLLRPRGLGEVRARPRRRRQQPTTAGVR